MSGVLRQGLQAESHSKENIGLNGVNRENVGLIYHVAQMEIAENKLLRV